MLQSNDRCGQNRRIVSPDEGKLLFPSLAELDQLYPHIRIEMEKASYAQLRKGLQSSRYDAIVTLSFEAELLTEVQVKRIEQVKCYFILSDRHPLYAKEDLAVFRHRQLPLCPALSIGNAPEGEGPAPHSEKLGSI